MNEETLPALEPQSKYLPTERLAHPYWDLYNPFLHQLQATLPYGLQAAHEQPPSSEELSDPSLGPAHKGAGAIANYQRAKRMWMQNTSPWSGQYQAAPTWSLDPSLPQIPWLSRYGRGDNTMIPAKTGEYVIPDHVVKAKGTDFFDNLVKKYMPSGGTGSPQRGYILGGVVAEGGRRGGYNFDFGQGGFGFPPADMGDVPSLDQPPFSSPGNTSSGMPTPAWSSGEPISTFYDPTSSFSGPGGGYYPGGGGTPAFGGTQIPTQWVNYPGVGWVPMGVPVSDFGGSPMSGGGFNPGWSPFTLGGAPYSLFGGAGGESALPFVHPL